MTEEAGMSTNAELPYTIQQIDSENRATIEKDHIEFVEQKRLGLSRFIIEIKHIISCEIIPGDEGDEILVQRRMGNAMKIGPVDRESARTAVALIQSLRP